VKFQIEANGGEEKFGIAGSRNGKSNGVHAICVVSIISADTPIIGEQLARKAANNAVNEVNNILLQTAIDCASPDAFCSASVKLRFAAEKFRPKCRNDSDCGSI
jgi:hypothetical protein